MLKLFKKKIPKDNVTEVTIQQSWTVEWTSYTWSYGNFTTPKHNAKVFIKHEDALEYKKQLQECAKFINSTVHTNIKEN